MASEYGNKCYIDSTLNYEQNCEQGPFGAFKDTTPYVEVTRPDERFMGYPVRLALGIGAGTLPNSNYIKAALNYGWDIVTYKTVRLEEYPCAEAPNFTPIDVTGDLTLEQAEAGVQAISNWNGRSEFNASNSYGVPSADKNIWIPDAGESVEYARNYPGGGKLVIVSFQGTPDGGDFIKNVEETARAALDTGAKVFQKNTSCPNEGNRPLLCFDTQRSGEAAEAARRALGWDVDLIFKIAYFANDQLLEEFVKEVGPYVNAIDAINTIPGRVRNAAKEQYFPGAMREKSGFSGDGIRHFGLDMVRRLRRILDKLDMDHVRVIGTGGITKPEHIDEYQEAGADGGVLTVVGSLANPHLAIDAKAFRKTA